MAPIRCGDAAVAGRRRGLGGRGGGHGTIVGRVARGRARGSRAPDDRGAGAGLDAASVFPVDSPFGGFPHAPACPHRVAAAAGRRRRALAQLAEHRSPKPKVGGSSPSCPARTRTAGRQDRPDDRGEVTSVTDSKAVRGSRDSGRREAHQPPPRSTARSSPSCARSSGRPRSSWSPTSSWSWCSCIFMMALVSVLDLALRQAGVRDLRRRLRPVTTRRPAPVRPPAGHRRPDAVTSK